MKYGYGDDGVFNYVTALDSDDFDKSGRMSIWKLSKILEGARTRYRPMYKSVNLGDLFGGTSMTLFIRSQWFKIYPAFYSVLKLRQSLSVKVNVRMSHLGRTSVCSDTELLDLTTNELLATASTHLVLVSTETRRPTPIPSYAKKFMTVFPSPEERPVSGPQFPGRPSVHFAHVRTVMSSDSDINHHLNQASFIRYCCDCASMAAVQGRLSAFPKDVVYADAKEVWVLYLHEARVGQELTIRCWEDENMKHIIWVEVSKESQILGQCQITYFEDDIKKHSSDENKEKTVIAKL